MYASAGGRGVKSDAARIMQEAILADIAGRSLPEFLGLVIASSMHVTPLSASLPY